MTKYDKVRLSPKFGLNLSTLSCDTCGSKTPIVFGRLRDIQSEDVKAPIEVRGLCIDCQISTLFDEMERRLI